MESKKTKLDRHLLRRIFSYTKPYKSKLYLSIILSIALAIFAPLRPYLIKVTVDKYILNNVWNGFINIIIIQILILLVETIFSFSFSFISNWLGQTVVNDLRKDVFKKVLYQRLAYFDHNAIGTLTTRTINDIEAINDIFSQGFISIIADCLTIISILAVMFVSSWKLTLVSIAVMPLLLLATYVFKNSVNKSFTAVRNAVSALNAFVQEHISGMYVVQAFSAENRELRKFQEIDKNHRDANIRGVFAYAVFFPIVEIIVALSTGLLVWWGASKMLTLEVTQGDIIAFILYLNLLFRPLRMLADKFNTLQMGVIAGERVFKVLDSGEHLLHNGSVQPKYINGDIRFDHVEFEYITDLPVLRGISFHVEKGQSLALVGHTGAGKTSIISIITRLYEIKSGMILIDDLDLKSYDIYELRKHIGIVLQDVFLFTGTIYENITMMDSTIPLAQVEHICKMLGMHEFIMSLPNNYHFNVQERGNTLSQGQRQLLSFARALLYNPSVLILDEATASVDSESEILIQKAIDSMIAGRTSIIIAHRLSTIQKADQIIVMDHGKIMEKGTHAELLLNKDGIYTKMYEATAAV